MPSCEYGSRVKSTVTDNLVWITYTDIVAAITPYVPWVGPWLEAIRHQIVPNLLDVQELCSTVPEEPPSIDLEALAISGELWKVPNLLGAWISTWWRSLLWNTYCECTPGYGSGPCSPIAAQTFNVEYAPKETWKQVADIPFPAGWTTTTVKWWNLTFDVPIQVAYDFLDADHNPILPFGPREHPVTIWPASSSDFWLYWWDDEDTTQIRYFRVWLYMDHVRTGSISVEFPAFTGECSNVEISATPYVPPPAPPDPEIPAPPALPIGCTTDDICARLDQLSKAVSLLNRDVTLIQRQAVPFAYVYGATRTISGTGQFSIQGLLGLIVNVTSSPDWLGGYPGTPVTKLNYGWLSIGTLDGWQRTVPLRHDPQLLLELNPAATRVGYTLTAGVVATVTDLKREP